MSGGKASAGSLPVVALAAAVLLVATVAGLIVTGHAEDGSVLIALVVTAVPSLFANAFAERTSRDLRNGVVEEKARKGATQALDEHATVRQTDAATTLAMQSLKRLLELNNTAMRTNTDATQANTVRMDADEKAH